MYMLPPVDNWSKLENMEQASNLELVLHPDGFLQIYVLDAHAENFVRIPAYSMTSEIQDTNNSTKQILYEAVKID